MKYIDSKQGWKHTNHPNEIFKYKRSAVPCNLAGIGVDVYESDKGTYLLKAMNNDGVYNKTKISDGAEVFFNDHDQMIDYIDRDVYNDASSLQRLLNKIL